MKPEDVQYWDEYKGILTQPQRSKARKFVDLIEYMGNDRFACNPIPGYNSTIHLITKDPEFRFRCSCQGFVSKERRFRQIGGEIPFCSHIIALLMAFSSKKFDRWYLRIPEEEE